MKEAKDPHPRLLINPLTQMENIATATRQIKTSF